MRLLNPAELGLYAHDRRRRVLRISQGELAARIGVSRYWVIDFEAGRQGAEVGLVFRALAALGIHLHAIPKDAEAPVRVSEDGSQAGSAHGTSSIDLDAIVDADVAPLPISALPRRSRSSGESPRGTARSSSSARKRRSQPPKRRG